jgi:hypothetical protein
VQDNGLREVAPTESTSKATRNDAVRGPIGRSRLFVVAPPHLLPRRIEQGDE